MSIFKTTDSLRDYIEVSVSLSLEDILPSINQASQTYILPILGKVQYDAVMSACEGAASDEDLTNDMKPLVNKVRLPLANYALAVAIPRLQTMISSAGVQINSNNSQKTAFGWQVKQAVESYLKAGDAAADALLDWLEENKLTYTDWAESSAYTVFKNCFVNTTAIFQAIRSINGSRKMFLQMKPYMEYIQDKHIKGTIGKEYYDELLAEIASGEITEENVVILDMIRKAVVNLASSVAAGEMSVSLDADGILVKSSSNADDNPQKGNATEQRLGMLVNTWREMGESYLRELSDFLNSEATASVYATYFESSKYVSPATSTGIYSNPNSFNVGLF